MPNCISRNIEAHPSHIRSFVLRQGRLTPAQARAFAMHWTQYGLEPLSMPRDFKQIFGRTAPLVLEIGFGNGQALRYAAQQEPEKNFIGVEVHRPGVGRLLNSLAHDGVGNVRVFHDDVIDVLTHEIALNTLHQVRIYFPDPWPKKRHHKRRLIQPDFVNLIATRMENGGLLHLATDWADYAEHMSNVLDNNPQWRNLADEERFVPRPQWRIETHFEQRGVRLGHGVWDLLYTRIC